MKEPKEPPCCYNCDEWEMDEGNVRRGYCPVFDKHSKHDHGAQCTAWKPNYEAKANGVTKPANEKLKHGGEKE